MTIETLVIKSKAALTLTPDSGNTVHPLLEFDPFTKSGYRTIAEYVEVVNMQATSWIYSTAPVEFPVFELEDSESKQLLTAINLEWKSPRIQLDVVLKVGGGSYQKIKSYSLLNNSPYPYREFSLGNHNLGDNAAIGLQIRNVGFGLLQNGTGGQDRVACYADVIRTILIEKLVDNSQKIVNSISDIAAIIVNANVNRQGIVFFNSSDKDVYLDTVSTVSTVSHTVLLEPGDYWEPPTNYTGNYYAVVASGSTSIDIREFV